MTPEMTFTSSPGPLWRGANARSICHARAAFPHSCHSPSRELNPSQTLPLNPKGLAYAATSARVGDLRASVMIKQPEECSTEARSARWKSVLYCMCTVITKKRAGNLGSSLRAPRFARRPPRAPAPAGGTAPSAASAPEAPSPAAPFKTPRFWGDE